MEMLDAKKRLRDALAQALDQLEQAQTALTNASGASEGLFHELDRSMRWAAELAEASRRFALLFRPPRTAPYDAAALLRILSGQVPALAVEQQGPPRDVEEGDQAQILECVKLLVDNARLNVGDSFNFAAVLEGDAPHYALVFSSPAGSWADPLRLRNLMDLSRNEFSDVWTNATGGGYATWMPDGVQLFLQGDAPQTAADEAFHHAGAALDKTRRHLRPWCGSAASEEGLVGEEESRRLYEQSARRAAEHLRIAQDALED
jgi:hypothetical protein